MGIIPPNQVHIGSFNQIIWKFGFDCFEVKSLDLSALRYAFSSSVKEIIEFDDYSIEENDNKFLYTLKDKRVVIIWHNKLFALKINIE